MASVSTYFLVGGGEKSRQRKTPTQTALEAQITKDLFSRSDLAGSDAAASARGRPQGEEAGRGSARGLGAGRGRSSVSGGLSRSLTPAAATLARGCFLHPGIFWSLHPGSSKVPGPKTGSKCDGSFRSQAPLGPLRPVEPVRPPCCPPALAGRRQLPALGHRGRGGSWAFVTLKLQSPHAHARASLSGPGLWRWRGLQSRVAISRRGTASDPAGAENGGGFGGAKWRRDPWGWGGVGREIGERFGPGNPESKEAFLAFS